MKLSKKKKVSSGSCLLMIIILKTSESTVAAPMHVTVAVIEYVGAQAVCSFAILT